MKILAIALVLGHSLSVFGSPSFSLNAIKNDSLPPVKVVERLDTIVSAPVEEAWKVSDKQQMVLSSVQFSSIINKLENGELSQEEAQEAVDSLISSIYLASASFFENYKRQQLKVLLTLSIETTSCMISAILNPRLKERKKPSYLNGTLDLIDS